MGNVYSSGESLRLNKIHPLVESESTRGILPLQELHQMYRPKNVPEVIAVKTGEFWSQMKRSPNESVDAYYNHFHELLEDLNDADEPISMRSAIRHFIFTLGSDLESIHLI